MIRPVQPQTQANSNRSPESAARPGIDSLAAHVRAIRNRLAAGSVLPARELRQLWAERIRPFWRLEISLYRSLTERLVELGENYLAIEVAQEAGELFGDDARVILSHARAAARCGATRTAQELLEEKASVLRRETGAKTLMARTFKDLWRASGEAEDLQQAFDLYLEDYRTTTGDRCYPGVNAASLALLLGRTDEARTIAGEVSALGAASSGYWHKVNLAECRLVLGAVEEARSAYRAAASIEGVPYTHLAAARTQARLLLKCLGLRGNEFDPCFPLPSVAGFSGHRVDAPGRRRSRFPESLAACVKDSIAAVIQELNVGFGYASAASGSDILFLEAMQEAGRDTFIHLPLNDDEFVRNSVRQPGAPEWEERFHRVIARATEITRSGFDGHDEGLAFDYGNRILLGAACQKSLELGADLHLVAVWDGGRGERIGGTGDYIQLAEDSGLSLRVIPLPAAQTEATFNAGDAAAPRDEPLTAEAREWEERILSILVFSLKCGPGETEAELNTQLAAMLERCNVLYREVFGSGVRLFFGSPREAAQTALAVASRFAGRVSGAIGLHCGPVTIRRHPVTGTLYHEGAHAARAGHLAGLQPAGQIYASFAFAAIESIQPAPNVRCEYLGRRRSSGGEWEKVFRVVPKVPAR